MNNIINERQLEAINSSDNPLLIIAGAGSGKTFVLTERILKLVKDYNIQPEKIIAFTFTNKAANEIKKRVLISAPNNFFKWIGTFHSICLKILREDSYIINRPNNFLIIDEDDQTSILREIYLINNFSKDDISIKKCLGIISTLKSRGLISKANINDFLEEKSLSRIKHLVNTCLVEYEKYLVEKNYFDFDDLIKNVNKIFSINEEILIKWKNRFNYVLVDEFQDTNKEQFELVKYLTTNKKNILVVGDPDQMIYSWRGANENIFNDFRNFFLDYKMIILEQNYRSTTKILSVSNQLIANNIERVKKTLFTKNIDGNNVSYFNAESQDEESKWIINKIEFLINKLNYSYSDIVILYRSNFLSRSIEQYLFRRNVPYVVYGGLKFFRRKEVKDILSFLKYITVNDDVSLARIYNTPKRKFSNKTYEEIVKFSKSINNSVHNTLYNFIDKIDSIGNAAKNSCKNFNIMIDKIKNFKYITISDLIDFIIKETNYEEYLKDDDEFYRMENINELKNSINGFQQDNPKSSLFDYLQEISLYTENENDQDDNDFISLMTVHGSKGLEFKNVFILGFNDEIFPSGKSIKEGGINEERRVAYVAMTRAKENLFITSSNGINFQNNNQSKIPSRFIWEISKNSHLDVIEGTQNENIFKKYYPPPEKLVQIEQNYHQEEIFFEMGDLILHSFFGKGIVIGVFESKLTISFPAPFGKKNLSKNHKSIVKIN